MNEIITCQNCDTQVEIEENFFFFEAKKEIEKAICPHCQIVLKEKEMSGWLFVLPTKTHIQTEDVCIYPMS